MKLTIKRSEWLRGEGEDNSRLLRSHDGKKCCLGFLATSLSCTDDQIEDQWSPACVPTLPWPEGFTAKSKYADNDVATNAACQDLMTLNDDQHLSERDREFAIADEFKRFGIEVEFVD
jgi:hypothetical protein